MMVSYVVVVTNSGGTSSDASIARIDRLEATFDDESLVADAGLLMVATLCARLGLEALIDTTVRLGGSGRRSIAGP